MIEPSVKWTAIFNCFDPIIPVSGNRLDSWFVEREYSPLSRLALSLRPDHLEQKNLLVGQRGCGKTSELFKLISEMQQDYFTLYIDLFASLELEMASRIELLFCIGTAVYKAAKEQGLKPSKRLWKDLVSSLSTLVRQQMHQADFNIDPVAALASALCTAGVVYPGLGAVGQAVGDSVRFGFGVGRKNIERLELEPVLREVIARTNAIIKDVEQKAKKPLLMVADGLDKIENIEQAKLIFGRSWVLTTINCRAIYTVPIILYYSTMFREVRNYFNCQELPNVRLHARGEREQLDVAGFNAMKSLVEKRLKSAGMEVEQVFTTEALDLLIRMSGGLMRDLVFLVRQAALEAEQIGKTLIELPEAQQVVNRLRREMEAGLYKEHYQALENIEHSGGIIEGKDPAEMDLLRDRYVVSYENGGFWRDIHPLVLPILEEYRARKRMSQFQEKGENDQTVQP